ncbi:MAG: potassium/proton antiporter, partial [Tetrasphaera sp.]|nr:potassium/proton antiporter [Tetrasphaera sp.]
MLPLAGDAQTGFTLGELTTALLVGSLTLIVCVVAIRLSNRTGLPSLLIYLGIGLLIGENGLGIRFEDEQLTLVLGYAALVLILIEGGLTT